MNSLTTPQLLFLATAIILAHLWHRPWFLTTHVSPLPDNASAGSPSSPAVDSQNRAPFDILHPNPTADTDGETTQAEVDIIAVHGLGSNVDWSWTWKDKARPGSPVNWLRDPDMLPRVIPKSRIMVYNYESRWHVNAPRTRLQLCGEELVRNLHAFRKGLQDRPVIFVGHSLGGLVIQHALLFADREDEFRYLPRHTSGFVALGSPFRGTKLHGVANFVARLLFLVGSHRGVLEALGYDNQLLRDKLQEFCRLRESMSIPTCCFFEAYDTDYGRRFGLPGLFRGMVVPEESACVPGWERSQLQTDHLKLNKFSGPLDRSFLAVSRQIFTMCNTAKNTVEDIAVSPRQHWMVTFERNEGFVGREDVLRILLDRISPSANKDACQRTAIQGLGGIGKTQIALEVAFRLRDADPSCSVFWVPAVDATTFENAYRDIGQRLGVAGLDDDKADVKTLVQAAISREDTGRWLLIIDNADDPELMFGSGALACHLPCSTNGSILFTTRTREVTNQLDIYAAGIIEPTKMKREEAREMLQARLREDQVPDRASTDSLLDFLDDLPLAIRQASAYMFKTGISTTRYLEYCLSSDATLVKLLSQEFEDRGRYDRIKNPVATTWLISFKHISRDNRRAGEYLEFMCFLAERDIPISLLPPASDEIETEEAVGTLEAYGFITRREEGESLDMHRLVRLAMWNWLREEGQARQRYCGVVQRLDEVFPFPKHENREIWMRYMAHAQRVAESDEECEDEEAILGLLFNVAEALSIQGRYKGAAKLYRETLEAREKVLGKEHPSTLSSMNNLALMLNNMGEYEEAEKMHRETLGLKEKAFGKEHPSTLNTMNNLASMLGKIGKYEEAEKMHRETLEAREKVLGNEHLDTLGSMNNLANMLRKLGEYEEAEKMHRETLKLTEKVLGKEHPSTLDNMNNLALVLDDMGEYDEAEKIHRETLELKEKVLGKEHPSTLDSMNNLALMLGNMGEYEEAEKMHRETLELKEKVLGKEHPSTLGSMNNLALVLNNMGEYEEAEKMHRKTLELKEKVLGKEHPSTLGSMNNLALVLNIMGKYKEAEKMHREILGVMEKVLGKEHPDTLDSMNNLALVLDNMGEYKEAKKMHRETLELMEKVLGKEHPSTLSSMNNLANVLRKIGEYEEAEKTHRKTLELKEKVLGKEHPSTLGSMNNLALMLDKMGDYEEAEKMHRETLEVREKVLGKEHPSTLDSMNNLALVLGNMGEYEEAEKMHREEWKLTEKVLGKEHPSTLDSMNNLANVLDNMGKYKEAEKMYRKTLKLKEKVFGKEHLSTLNSMNNLANVLGR